MLSLKWVELLDLAAPRLQRRAFSAGVKAPHAGDDWCGFKHFQSCWRNRLPWEIAGGCEELSGMLSGAFWSFTGCFRSQTCVHRVNDDKQRLNVSFDLDEPVGHRNAGLEYISVDVKRQCFDL